MNFLKQLFADKIHKDKRLLNQGEASIIVIEWLVQFKNYLPSSTASDHAKGAHDAIDDLTTWINKSKSTSEKP